MIIRYLRVQETTPAAHPSLSQEILGFKKSSFRPLAVESDEVLLYGALLLNERLKSISEWPESAESFDLDY